MRRSHLRSPRRNPLIYDFGSTGTVGEMAGQGKGGVEAGPGLRYATTALA